MVQSTVQLVRPATSADADEIIRLRSSLLQSAGAYYASRNESETNRWRQEFRSWLADLTLEDSARVAVIDAPNHRTLIACGIGVIDHRPPAPGILNARCGWIQSVVTDINARRQGHGRSIVDYLVRWFAQHGVARVFLHATIDGRSIYEKCGFNPCGEIPFVLNELIDTATSAPSSLLHQERRFHSDTGSEP